MTDDGGPRTDDQWNQVEGGVKVVGGILKKDQKSNVQTVKPKRPIFDT